jgi:hypothetical protein
MPAHNKLAAGGLLGLLYLAGLCHRRYRLFHREQLDGFDRRGGRDPPQAALLTVQRDNHVCLLVRGIRMALGYNRRRFGCSRQFPHSDNRLLP